MMTTLAQKWRESGKAGKQRENESAKSVEKLMAQVGRRKLSQANCLLPSGIINPGQVITYLMHTRMCGCRLKPLIDRYGNTVVWPKPQSMLLKHGRDDLCKLLSIY